MICEMFLSSALFVACLLNFLTPSHSFNNNANQSNFNNERNVNQIYKESDLGKIFKISENTSNNYNLTSSITTTPRAFEENTIPNINIKSRTELKRRKFTTIRQSSGAELATEPIIQFSEEGRVKKKKETKEKRAAPIYHNSEYVKKLNDKTQCLI